MKKTVLKKGKKKNTKIQKKHLVFLSIVVLLSIGLLLYFLNNASYKNTGPSTVDLREEEEKESDREVITMEVDGEEVLGISETFYSSSTWTAPSTVTEVAVEVWGAGGGSPAPSGNAIVTGGGGGGAYSSSTLAVTPSANYSYVIGTGSGGGVGGDTYWVNNSTLLAKGGAAGGASNQAGGAGGAAASGVGTVRYSGGVGDSGGGGGAGSTGNGKPASGTTGGGATAEFGGSGGTGVNSGAAGGQNGNIYGGGGGGSRRQGGPISATSGANGLVRITYSLGPAVYASLGKSSVGWSGAVTVVGTLSELEYISYPYMRAKVVTPASETHYVDMSWNTTLSRFEGVIYPGSWYCNGCADPNTGTYTVTVELDNSSDFSSIDYTSGGETFSTYITRRMSSFDTNINYTTFVPIWNAGGWWDYNIYRLAVQTASVTGTDTVIAIPFHPVTSTISNISVSYGATSISQGTPFSTGNAWWWDEPTHTLYVQFGTLTTTLVDVNISFRSQTDLFVTRYDRTQTKDMGNRLFINGLMVANRYFTTFILGGGHEGSGAQFESRATRQDLTVSSSADCMERTAIYVNDSTNCDSSGYYSCSIKWRQDQWQDYIVSESNDTIVIVNDSDPTPTTGYKQQLDTGLAVKRTQTYTSNKRYIKNVHELTNGGATARKYPFVWMREQWLGADRMTNDRGRFSSSTQDITVDKQFDYSTLTDYWHVTHDAGNFVGMGVIFDPDSIDNASAFLNRYAVIQNTAATWPFAFQEHSLLETENIGFLKTYNSVQPDETVSFTFWQWIYYTTSYSNIESAMIADYGELVVPSDPPTDPTIHTGNDLDVVQIAFNNAKINSHVPVFRVSATHADGFDAFEIELNKASDFTGTAYTGQVLGTYASGTHYNISVTIPTTNGITYYARARASSDGGSNWSGWSAGVWSFTYNGTVEDAHWYQTEAEQFNTGTLSNTVTNTFDEVVMSTSSPVKNWYNASWLYRKKITIDSSKVLGESLTNFPVYIDLSDLGTEFFSNVLSNGGDIRVTTSDGQTEIAREVVNIDTVNGSGELHFKAPSLSNVSNTSFYIYYGNSLATEPLANSTYGSQNVWTSNYVSVWHKDENTVTQTYDSTSQGNNGSFQGSLPTTVSGKLTSSQQYDGDGDYVSLGTSDPSTSDMTISMWLNWSGTNGNAQTLISKRDGSGLTDTRWELIRESTGEFYFRSSMDTGYFAQLTTFPQVNKWTYLTLVKNVSDVSLYLDGQFVNTNSMTFGNKTDAVLRLGSIENGVSSFNGIIDEARISSSVRNANWIGTEFNNQNSPTTFYDVYYQEKSDSEEGSITSTAVELAWVPTALREIDWDEVVVNASTVSGNGIFVQVLNSSGIPLTGYNCSIFDGASTCTIDLTYLESLVSNETLYLKSTLIDNGGGSPSLTSWALKWQTTEVVLSITVSDGIVTYGVMPVGQSLSTISFELDDMQTVTNQNPTAVDLYIKGLDSANWLLGASAGTDTFVHEFCNSTDSNCSAPPTNYTALTTSYQLLKSAVASYATVDFHLRLSTPTSTAIQTQQQMDVTVMITAN